MLDFMLCLRFNTEDGSNTFHQSVDWPARYTWRYISVGRILHNHRCENIKSYKFYVVSIA
jgi:hypothetical protein